MISRGREGTAWIDMVGAIILGFDIFRINRATLFLKVKLHLFPGISKPILSKAKAQIHVYHPRILPAVVLRP